MPRTGTKKKNEEAKISIRNIRREAIDTFKKSQKKNEITEDELNTNESKIQKLTDKYTSEIDKLTEEKNAEIMTI